MFSIFITSCISSAVELYPLPENIGTITLDGSYYIEIFSVQKDLNLIKEDKGLFISIEDGKLAAAVNYEINNTTDNAIDSLRGDDFELIYATGNGQFKIVKPDYIHDDYAKDEVKIDPGDYQELIVYYYYDSDIKLSAVSYQRNNFILLVEEADEKLTQYLDSFK